MTVELPSLAELETALAGARAPARVYIGYGATAPSAPEPCRLPPIAYTFDAPQPVTDGYSIGK